MSYRLSHVADKSVLFVMAASPEYGPHLQARIAPLMTGIGPVEAAIAVTAVLAGLDAADHLPDLVVSLGSAGSRTLEQTGVYQAISVSYRDMDASAFGFEKGCTPLLDLPAEVALPLRIPDIAEARLSTGANVVSGEAYGLIDADMVEMETFAVLRACQRFGVPLVSLRGISDGKEDVNHVDDWTEYLHVIDEKLADAVDRLCRAIEDGVIAL
ncbi:5'-methylthioadenosine/S-adenosylhomocysteine nucleosidase [Agrobacterium salinitolerans]|uniref:5'-methylthioadenosine/S-adenosylhomocysteine nucleosidase n=1 Tax=Agrobacterium salinitolerans TaxID=1183413 RepID=A0A4Z1QSU4_9HYPH|nr:MULTISPECIES: 5'-methylthioadenosine/S-adenosylhomocysteine nucleosidase [Agrobacterium]MBA4776985.1 5'-methylthioadenosine/S-adenosylhomocysteine nucleosidase [Hyphomicrobiales bacterium]MCZ7850856.1 5'-methylthioadenosine/S-adenosylhomocysteine nucleosidase [Agrobacterium salinitolerans]MCZ7856548.1 5'-methylthioadenosine/S-adenosylhomocysteine nucleosidase [Agrobacterium salinitolerans]MCZ7863400.1 5'-methylthioadenosine/S-adenosylhomocysteine nucleosidase [Agrobacterium salinitolerans]M